MNLNNTRLITTGFANALGVMLYTLAIAWLIENLGQIFNGSGPVFLQISAFLMLLVLSVAIVGLFIFGWPILLYIQGHKKEAIILEGATIGALIVLTALALIMNIVL